MSMLILGKFVDLPAFVTTVPSHRISNHFPDENIQVQPRIPRTRTEYSTVCHSVAIITLEHEY